MCTVGSLIAESREAGLGSSPGSRRTFPAIIYSVHTVKSANKTTGGVQADKGLKIAYGVILVNYGLLLKSYSGQGMAVTLLSRPNM